MSKRSTKDSQSRIVTLDQARALGASHRDSSGPGKKSITWKDFGVYLDKKLDRTFDPSFVGNSPTAPGVLVNILSRSSTLSQVVKFQICKSCNRPIGEDILAVHYPKCLEMKNKKQDAEGSSASAVSKRKRGRNGNALLEIEYSSVDSSRGASPTPITPSSSQNPQGRPKKKYKKSQMQKEKEAANAAAAAAAAAEAANNRASTVAHAKKKKQAKVKAATKAKGPVDVEKQCGVPLPSGGFCARSLTCKTHSMGAKRAVPGRSAPYDVLLQQYQKRNQAKLAASNALAAQRRENAQLTGMSVGDSENGDSLGNLHVVLDSDTETQLVLEGLSKNFPAPLERKIMLPVRHRHKFLYMREAYANALITNGSTASDASSQSPDLTLANQAISGSIGGLQGRCALVNVDNKSSNSDTQSYAAVPGEIYQVRAPSKAILMTAQYNHQQQQLFQQQILKLQQQQLLAKQRLSQQQHQQQQNKV
ncbi:hypothetical protein JCM33374_g104 [Metschnikowia sp. JCM 33374]|nr:hypothetical protein JCM33374_g104 [Metschnikowia sp. JCM 33374]